MNAKPDLFWEASLEEMKQGYTYNNLTEEYTCLLCGKSYADGMIYAFENQLYEARKYIKEHIRSEHLSPFHFLLDQDKKLTGLTEHQKRILELFYDGYSDQEIAHELKAGSTSTIRNHRFSLKEKQKQAKIFLAIMELLTENTPGKSRFIEFPRNAQNVDDRYAITLEENQKILTKHFLQGLDGPLHTFPLKEKKRIVILKHILKSFDINKTYNEKEINEIIKKFYDDYAVIRRNLIDYGFMDRSSDGSVYRVKV